MSETAVSYAFEQLGPSESVSPDSLAALVAQASAEADGIRELARAEGHAEGRVLGYEEGFAEISSASLALHVARAEIGGRLDEVALAVERDAIELALALAEKILSGALQAKPELIAEVVQGALRRISDRRRITVLVNPADLKTVRSALGDLNAQAGGAELCEVQADPRVQLGGAIAQTEEGEVDASVQTQLERAREVILAELETRETVT